MFTTDRAFSSFSVGDVEAARRFYGETLGLDVSENSMGFLTIRLASGAEVLAYEKSKHEASSFTIMNFIVDDLEAAVDDLNSRGIMTKIYPDDVFPSDEKGIVRGDGEGPDIAWFLDPAGNPLAVMEE